MLHAEDILRHIPALVEHEYGPVLHRIAADQHPALHVKDRDTARSVAGDVDDLERPSAQIDDVTFSYGDDRSGSALLAVVGLLGRAHIHLIKGAVARGVVHVGVGVEQDHGQAGQALCDVLRVGKLPSGVDEDRLLAAAQKKDPYTVVLDAPCTVVDLYDLCHTGSFPAEDRHTVNDYPPLLYHRDGLDGNRASANIKRLQNIRAAWYALTILKHHASRNTDRSSL